ncbi:transmembrane protein, putative [Medicago truncatula]|uniref:Transmembrane protein, putative n=1 Tax=Medicago truncatula TaxID=3880 RepID=A0A072TDF5_MEDTR|nr:transmembrane protein, putative [Medicago truncatula]
MTWKRTKIPLRHLLKTFTPLLFSASRHHLDFTSFLFLKKTLIGDYGAHNLLEFHNNVASKQNQNSCSLFIEPPKEDDCRFIGAVTECEEGEKEGGYRMLMERKEKFLNEGGNLDLKHMKRDIDIDKDSKNECHLSVLYCLTEWDLVQSSVCFCFIWLLCICISCFLRLSFYGCGDLEGCGDVLDLDLRKMKRCIC